MASVLKEKLDAKISQSATHYPYLIYATVLTVAVESHRLSFRFAVRIEQKKKCMNHIFLFHLKKTNYIVLLSAWIWSIFTFSDVGLICSRYFQTGV